MKIVHLICVFPPYKGGQGNVCLAEVEELAELGHQVVVYTPQNSKSQILNHKFQIKYFKPLFKYGNAAFVPGIIKGLKNFDLIHLHWPFLGGSEIFLLWRLFRKKPKLIVQYHMDLIAPGLRGLIFKLNSFLFAPLMVKLADKILVSSQDYLEHSDIVKYWRKNKEKFVISPFGVNQEIFAPQDKSQKLMAQCGLKEGDRVVLSVGGLDKAHYFKGVKLLIRAMAELKDKMPDLRLVLVGDGDLRPEYERLAKDLKIDRKIFFAGRVEDDKLPDYYNLADVFILPSLTRSEAFGTVCLEAMACAKPIIVSDLPGLRDLVEDNGLLVKVDDLEDLGEKIYNLFQNYVKLKEMGINGLRIVKEKYYWPDIVRQLGKIYVQAVDSQN